MANIAITTYCNLHCPYCFANDMISSQDIKNIELEQFKRILDWIVHNKTENDYIHLGIIGGEPTLHPQFSEILKILQNYYIKFPKLHTILFTNGIYIHKFIDELPENVNLLINVNAPDAMKPEQWIQLNHNLNYLYSHAWIVEPEGKIKATMGCNLCMEIDDYSFFWNLVDKFRPFQVRMSVTAPIKLEYQQDKELYYNLMKPKFLQFVNKAKELNVILGKDCNQIPDCYFSNEELELIDQQTIKANKLITCLPVIDITPDFQASACFGAYDLVSCEDFNTLEELEFYLFNKKTMPKFMANGTGKCKTCKKHKLLQCQGGCLAFSPLQFQK